MTKTYSLFITDIHSNCLELLDVKVKNPRTKLRKIARVLCSKKLQKLSIYAEYVLIKLENHAVLPGHLVVENIFDLPEVRKYLNENHVTKREQDVLKHRMDGCSRKEAAEKCHISDRTADTHVHNVYSKLGVHSLQEAQLVIYHKLKTLMRPAL